jgi:uncharacterized protein (DUF1697 family)
LDLQEPQTYIQSGNVVFRTKERSLAPLTKRIEDRIESNFGFRPDVIARTCSELRTVIARNPFSSRSGIDPSKLLITFLSSAPDPEALDKVLKIEADPEELKIDGRECYIYFPNGMGRTKLPLARIEKMLKRSWTGRNLNTVLKLLEMAEKLEASKT